MARRTKLVAIDDKDSRDAGKSFLITEMASEPAEWWAIRMLLAAMGSDAEIDFDAPLTQMARQGLKALARIRPDQARPLLDEMMACVSVQLPGDGGVRKLLPDDIEDVTTRFKLRLSWWELHTGFLATGEKSITE